MLCEVIDAGPTVEKIRVLFFGAGTRHFKPPASKFRDEFRAVAGTCHAVELFAR